MQPWECPHEIQRPVMRQRWEQLTYLHWPVVPDGVQAMLPRGLGADAHDGLAAGGYPQPDDEPRVLYSPGVTVLVGRPERV